MSIESDLHELLNMFRYVFSEDRPLLRTIDEAYEETIMEDLALIPDYVKEYMVPYFSLLKMLSRNFNWNNFNKELKKIPVESFPDVPADTYYVFLTIMQNLDYNEKDMARIKNLTQRFKPIFVCFDKVIIKIRHTVDKIASYQNTDTTYDDLL